MVLSPQSPEVSPEPSALIPPQSPPQSFEPTAPLTPAIRAEDFFKHQGYEPSLVNMSVSQQFESPEAMRSRLKREEMELKARLEKEKTERNHHQFKDLSIHIIGILLVIVLGATSVSCLYNSGASLDEKAWARTILTSLITAVIGYIFGSKGNVTK